MCGAALNVRILLSPLWEPREELQKIRGFDFSGEDRIPAELYNKILWEGLKGTAAPAAKTRFSKVETDEDKDGK
jgi:hypothetical protein